MSLIDSQGKKIIWASVLLSLLTWCIYASRWWVQLEGDAPLYPIVSTQILQGHQFIMTPGQGHGGSVLAYLRAAVFAVLGVSHFWGFYVNGLVVAASVGLWTRFAFLYAGPWAAAVFGLLAALGTERFARAACTDYFAMTLFTGGLMLNLAHSWSAKEKISSRQLFLGGLLLGFSWYVCRFSMLYFVGATLFFLSLCPATTRVLFAPSWSELWRGISKYWVSFLVVGLFGSVVAFFTSDAFFGINAESNLRFIILLTALLWLKHRWRFLVQHPRYVLVPLTGVLFGLLPEIIFRFLKIKGDRTTGLVRWKDFAELMPELPQRVGFAFSYYFPTTLGLVVIGFAIGILALGFFSKPRKVFISAFLALMVPLLAWLTVHTYMYLVTQYFFPVFFPLYLALGVVVAKTRFPKTAMILLIPIIASAITDLTLNFKSENYIEKSGVVEKLESWKKSSGVSMGFGHYPSNYNLMWALKGEWKLPWLEPDERFPQFADEVFAQKRIAYVFREGDRALGWQHPGYKVLEDVSLKEGFHAKLLEKADQ